MPALPDFKVSPSFQPKPENYDYDLDKALASVMGLHAIIPNDAFTAETLGTERAGNGVLINERGLVLSCSDMFFGHKHNLIMPGRAVNMSDGWETKRRRGPGHDWVTIKLGKPGRIRWIEVDTSYFKGNFPDSCSLEACRTSGNILPEQLDWKPVLPRTKLQAHTRHSFEDEILDAGTISHVRFNIFPDGGVSRLRLFGRTEKA